MKTFRPAGACWRSFLPRRAKTEYGHDHRSDS